ncbi:hypothetical protein N8I77_010695 [Diaporthe amygdali]|uniref:VOC domain-containing protein n=1 Tax=Phomopsis amygdali TaxID=1214568 RepID=A0AAD9S904_PHOAM|nr:hypothetical protein N8I77_010695 [Diaporthe amygdali]
MAIRDTSGTVLSPKRMCHIVLRVQPDKYKPMVNWYVTFLGGRVVWGNEVLSFITYDDEHHRIAITARPGTIPRGGDATNSCGLAHVSFAYETLDELLTAYVQRRKLGIKPSWCVNHGPTTSIYYADPDGNEVETQVDNFDTAQEATEFMNSAEFVENPMGVDFVPEELIRRLEDGESVTELKKRPNIGPRTSRAEGYISVT